MADLSGLGNLQPSEPLNLDDTYPVNRQSTFQLPPRGRYTLQAPQEFTREAFSATKAGNLLVTVDPTIVGPEHAGFKIRRTKVSAKVFERKGKPVSYLGDYLVSAGYRGPLTGDPNQQAEAVEMTAGATFEAELDWRAENFSTGFKLEGMSKFPRQADGTYQSWVEDPTEKNEDGTTKRLLANVYVRNYITPAE